MAAIPVGGSNQLGVNSDAGGRGLLRVVSPSEMKAADEAREAQAQQPNEDVITDALASHIERRMQEMRNFRNTHEISDRMLAALRTYKGKYSPDKLADIRSFGGSEVYARVTATKCRSATALLRDVYLGADRPWEISPTPEPQLPEDIGGAINQLILTEVATLAQAGQQIDPQMIKDRTDMLMAAAAKQALKTARVEAKEATEKLDDILVEGGFYQAFAEFLIDLPIFPYAVIKGPTVRNVQTLKWVNGKATYTTVPKMFWDRVSPLDLYFSSSATNRYHAEFVERIRLSRSDLLAVRDLPGYNKEAVNKVLEQFNEKGLRDWWDVSEAERAELEDRERWPNTDSGLIDTAEFHGSVQGSTLLDWGMDESEIPDPLQEYQITAWKIANHVIKAQLNPTPRQSKPYYVTSYEKVPGTMIGNGLPDILDDVQSVCNATMRALVNNLSIASGPQVVINDQVTQPGENDSLHPWKRWHINVDPMISSSSVKPIDFFQPNSNAAELLGVYEKYNAFADDISSIPRYMMGNEKVGGAGRTASGLAMLMGNAAKSLQNVAATIDRDVIGPLLHDLYDLIMLTNPAALRGDEQIDVLGVNFAVKREQDRMRQIEFMQLTMNPVDMSIVGPVGRANVLRSVASNLGLDHERVVPTDQELQMQLAGPPGAVPPQQQQPGPQEGRDAPEEVRRSTGVEGQFAGNGQAGGGTPSGG